MKILVCFLLFLTKIFVDAEGNGLVFDFVKENANFSVDPCHDFAAHMCPEGQDNVFRVIQEEYTRLWKLAGSKNHRMKRIWEKYRPEKLEFDISLMEEELLKPRAAFLETCETNDVGKMTIYNSIKLFQNRNDRRISLNSSTCNEMAIVLEELSKNPEAIKRVYSAIVKGARGLAVSDELVEKRGRFHQLFYDLRDEFVQVLKKTPWAINKHVINRYIAKLKKVTVNDFASLAPDLEEAIVAFDKNYQNCLDWDIQNKTTNSNFKIMCKIGALNIANEILVLNPKYLPDFMLEGATDVFGNLYNADDGTIFFGNYAELLVHSDMVPVFYGSLGFLLAHELMHTFVFDEIDTSPLKNYWTSESKCVSNQTATTCRNFGVPCGQSLNTFEEDAADFNGIRLTWNVYQKNQQAIHELQRKTTVKNAMEITKDQLFFYSMGIYLCDGRPKDAYSAGILQQFPHSISYIRMNNLASQMDQFHEAFKCKKDDAIVRNKVSECAQYGAQAPERKSARTNLDFGLF